MHSRSILLIGPRLSKDSRAFPGGWEWGWREDRGGEAGSGIIWVGGPGPRRRAVGVVATGRGSGPHCITLPPGVQRGPGLTAKIKFSAYDGILERQLVANT